MLFSFTFRKLFASKHSPVRCKRTCCLFIQRHRCLIQCDESDEAKGSHPCLAQNNLNGAMATSTCTSAQPYRFFCSEIMKREQQYDADRYDDVAAPAIPAAAYQRDARRIGPCLVRG